jgi:lipopolysaccharide export system protein LptA
VNTQTSFKQTTLVFPFARAASVIIVALSVCFAIGAQAERADRRLPVNITSLESDGDYADGKVKLSRNVLIIQGTLRITADTADVKTDDKNEYQATLVAKPVCFRQRTDKGAWAQGVAERIEYDSAKGIVEFFGNAHLFVGEDQHQSNYILYNINSNKFESRENKDRSKVQKPSITVLQPQEKDPPATAAAASAGADASAVPKTTAKPVVPKTATPPKRNEPAFSRCA